MDLLLVELMSGDQPMVFYEAQHLQSFKSTVFFISKLDLNNK